MQYEHEQSDSNRTMSDVERLYISMQKTFGGTMTWDDIGLHAQQIFVQSVNNIIAICRG